MAFDPTERLPKGPTPWLPQSACDILSLFCSAGQVPSEKLPLLTDWERTQRRKERCYAEVEAQMIYCRVIEKNVTNDEFKVCMRAAIALMADCDKIGKQPGY
jgi:hypothetical protein